MIQTKKEKDHVGELKKSIEVLKLKIAKAEKNQTNDSAWLVKTRSWRKSIKRAQRKMSFLAGKKIAAKKPSSEQGEKK